MISRHLILLALAALAGCATSPDNPGRMSDMDIVARDESFALVRLRRGQSFGTVAQAFYGNSLEDWQIREVNADTDGIPGQVLAVPLTPVNISSVYTDGFRTLPILCYHQFSDDADTGNRLELSAQVFEEQIRYLVLNGYQFLTFAQVSETMRAGKPIPEKAVVITIDDGYRSVYEVAWPILREYQVPATLFIYTDFIGADSALQWDQITQMMDSGLIEVQSHGKSHTSLSRLPTDKSKSTYSARVKQEVKGSDAAFKRHLGFKPIYHSYPFGNSSDTASAVLKNEGYLLAATVTRGDNTTFSDPFLLHRTMIYSDLDLAGFARLVRTWHKQSLK